MQTFLTLNFLLVPCGTDKREWQVIPSRADGEVKVSGVLGRAAPVEKKGPGVGDQTVGMGGTTQWKLASLVSS